MTQNLSVPYILQLKDDLKTINSTVKIVDNVENSVFLNSCDSVNQLYIQPLNGYIGNSVENESQKEIINYVYEVVHPDQLNLKPSVKRGRPKKRKNVIQVQPEVPKLQPTMSPVPRTRSGRQVKFPKHIQKYFKKVEIDTNPDSPDGLKTTDFARCDETMDNDVNELESLDQHSRKRNISAQYRCPKCKKAYLGKNKMLQHIKKYPDHGPVPVNQNGLNFDVWNYLVDITQKCPPARRGIKFCEELTNLLHNVLLLTSALFKKDGLNKNHVEVDKVLGNAIGLPPGLYNFNDKELYKDVTVLKLIKNSDFFKPIHTGESNENNVGNDEKLIEKNTTIDEDFKRADSWYSNNKLSCSIENICHAVDSNFKDMNAKGKATHTVHSQNVNFELEKEKASPPLHPLITVRQEDMEIENVSAQHKTSSECSVLNESQSNQDDLVKMLDNLNSRDISSDIKKGEKVIMDFQSTDMSSSNSSKCPTEHPTSTVHTNNSIDVKKTDDNLVHSELLSENSLLHLSSLRNSVDDLMLGNDESAGTLLENSTSSDDVMNVDQFVNERLKNIIEPDLDNVLNLDLPTIFNFHSS